MSTLQFSDTSAKLGIIQDCESKCLLGDGGISGNASLLKEFTRYVNKANSAVWYWIFSAYGGMTYDDGNQANLPSATDTLTSGQATYALPSSALTVTGIEVKNSGGVWIPLLPITLEQIKQHAAEGEFYKTAATPLYYRVVGTTVKLYPAANWTQSASFKVFFDRGSVSFASSDTTATPGFASEFHDALSVGASVEWLKVNKSSSSALETLRLDWNGDEDRTGREGGFKRRIKEFYSARLKETFPPRVTVKDATAEFQ